MQSVRSLTHSLSDVGGCICGQNGVGEREGDGGIDSLLP